MGIVGVLFNLYKNIEVIVLLNTFSIKETTDKSSVYDWDWVGNWLPPVFRVFHVWFLFCFIYTESFPSVGPAKNNPPNPRPVCMNKVGGVTSEMCSRWEDNSDNPAFFSHRSWKIILVGSPLPGLLMFRELNRNLLCLRFYLETLFSYYW